MRKSRQTKTKDKNPLWKPDQRSGKGLTGWADYKFNNWLKEQKALLSKEGF